VISIAATPANFHQVTQMGIQLAGMAGNQDESRLIKHCKIQLERDFSRAARKHGAPIAVAALAELTAEQSCEVAGPDLTIYLLLELAKQIAGQCADQKHLVSGLTAACDGTKELRK
jgi:hypothetical protein